MTSAAVASTRRVHPFSSGSGEDVRITTRTAEDDPFNCIYSTIHEVGHACYEQGIDPAYHLTPVGQGVSMGVHESQSRIYENQLGRNRAFCGYLYGRMRDAFGDFGVADEDMFYRTVNRVHRGYIRTEADEVQYNLHVMLRFDLERAMMSGDLQVRDLEAAWNDRFEADFGYAVDRPSNGVLQDVHWSVGLFGYFPTYSLGNVYAGCLFEALQGAVPELEAQLVQGNLSDATGWLHRHVQCHGGLYAPREVIANACGKAPSAAPLLRYLDEKFSALAVCVRSTWGTNRRKDRGGTSSNLQIMLSLFRNNSRLDICLDRLAAVMVRRAARAKWFYEVERLRHASWVE